MSRIFLSHSSANNDVAVALRDWLATQGWNDVFLDLDPQRGIAAGDRWERTLNQAALRCEAVLFLVSRAWLASEWCLRELSLAHRLNKRLFGLLIEDIPVGELPASLTGTWQLVQLASGRDHILLRAVLPSSHDEVHVTLSQEGLNRLRIGLERAGLDARFFAWPPANDPKRPPYRGLLPLEAADAGIFFGREAPTVEALDRIRGMRDAAPPRLMAVLGASGSGKSSFLRAGLLPRLARDDQNYLSLPIIRPERGVVTGASGLLRSIEAALGASGLPTARPEIRDAINGGATTLRPLLRALLRQTQKALIADDPAAKAATLVLAVDQGEELFLADGSAESAAFLALLRDLLVEDDPALIVLITIRSDSYESLQTAKSLEGIAQQAMSLVPMPRGAYQSVIEGPAARLVDTSHPLVIEPALTQALLSDIEAGGGRDALPLLAFTLERLYVEYGVRGRLTLNDYDQLGRIKGSIEAAIERVFRAADNDVRIPRDRDARLTLLRRGLIPWLAGIDPDTGTPRRQKARISEIPSEARPLIDLLVEQRLLSTDASADGGEATIEPAHEALLRQWGMLQGWLQSDFAALMNLEAVKRAAREWEANARNPDWLAHHAGRLEDAQQLLERPDLAPRLDSTGREYLTACLVQETNERRDKAAALERELALQSKARKRARAFGIAAVVVALLMTGLGALAVGGLYVADLQRQAALVSQSLFLARDARTATDNGTPTLGKLLAARALPKQLDTPTRPFVAEAEASLQYAYEQSRELLLLKGHQQAQVRLSSVRGGMQLESTYVAGSIDYAIYSADGTRIVTSSTDGTIRIWNADTSAQTAVIQTVLGKASHVSFLPDGMLLVLTDGSAPEIRNSVSGDLVKKFDGGSQCVVDESSNRINMGAVKIDQSAAAISADGKRIVTVSGVSACLWDPSGNRVSLITAPGDKMTVAKLSGRGDRLLLASNQGAGALVNARDGKIIADLGKQVAGASFSHDGKLFAVGTFDKTVTIRDASDGQVVATLAGHDGAVRSLDFSPDDTLLVTGSDDKTVRLWNTADRTPRLLPKSGSTPAGPAVYKHQNGVQSVTFGGDGKFVLVISDENEGVLWNVEHGWRRYLTEGTRKNKIVRMSRDGKTVVAYSDDHTIRIWKDSSDPIATMKAGDVTAASISSDGKRLVTGAADATAQVWTLEAKRPPESRWLDHHQTVHSLDFTPSNLIVTTDDHSIAMRDPRSGELVRC
jgi:WD40 repeat protein